MTYLCEFVDHPARATLVVRTRAAVDQLGEILDPAWKAIKACAAKVGAAPVESPFIVCHNSDERDLDLEIGFVFERPLEGEGEVRAGEIPGGRAAQCEHVGSYDELPAAHQALRAWVAERGLQAAGPAYEFYVDDPQITPPDELRTRLVMPLR